MSGIAGEFQVGSCFGELDPNEDCCRPTKSGTALSIVSGTGVDVVDPAARAARFDTMESGYEGKWPSAFLKSSRSLVSKLVSIVLSTVNSHSK